MKKLVEILTYEVEAAFEKAGYDKQYAKVTLSNRPDLCEYQCNGAMAAVKVYRKAPIMIANDVVAALEGSMCIEKVEAVNPGFINITLDAEFVASYLKKMNTDDLKNLAASPDVQGIIKNLNNSDKEKLIREFSSLSSDEIGKKLNSANLKSFSGLSADEIIKKLKSL